MVHELIEPYKNSQNLARQNLGIKCFVNDLTSFYSISAWVGSITFALTYGLTPVGHLVSQKLSVRQSVILGTALTGSSLLATSFVRELNVVFVTFSLIYGVGSSVLFMTAMRAASLYFDRRYSTAIGKLHINCIR